MLGFGQQCSAQNNDVVNFNFNFDDPDGVAERQRPSSSSQRQKELLLLEALARRKPGGHQSVDGSIVDLLGRSMMCYLLNVESGF